MSERLEQGFQEIGGVPIYFKDEVSRAGIETLDKQVDALADGMTAPYYAAGREAGAADMTMTKTLGDRAGLLRVLSHMKMGTFDSEGRLTHECRGGRLTRDVKGAEVAINGDDGDVMLYCDLPVYHGHCKETFDGTEHNMLSLGLLQHDIGTKQAQRIAPFAIVPHYTVNTKLSGDLRACAHSIYNTNIAGQYGAPAPLFQQTVKANGGGYPNQYVSSLASSQQARNKNSDPSVKDRWIGLAHNLEQVWWTAMYLEMGTLDFTDPSRGGYGCTNTGAGAANFADNGVSGISGFKVIRSGGEEAYYGIYNGNFKDANGATKNQLQGIENATYGFTEMLEAQRVLDKIAAANLVGYITPAGNTTATPTVFASGGATIAEGVNLLTGEGMVKGQKYYTVRNIPNCQGMADGVMTAVVNIYVALDFQDDCQDPSGNSLTGATGIFKFSHIVYRGKDMLSGMFQQLEGIHYTYYNDNDTKRQRLYVAESVDDIPVISQSDPIYGDIGTDFKILNGLTLVKDAFSGGGWMGDAAYDKSIFAGITFDGGQHSKEGGYIWLGACYGQCTNGQPAVGKECVCASVVGCNAVIGSAGRSLFANVAATAGDGNFAGGFALTSIQTK